MCASDCSSVMGLSGGGIISNVEVHHSLLCRVAGAGVLTVNAVPVVVRTVLPYQGGIHSLITTIPMTLTGHGSNKVIWLPTYPTG